MSTTIRKAFVLKVLVLLILGGIGAIPRESPAAEAARNAPALQQVPLPYSFHDSAGMQWDILPDGTIGAGNANVFDSGARLMVGPSIPYGVASQQAKFDAAENEIILSAQMLAELNVSRRIGVNAKEGWLRFTEVLENPTAATIRVPVHVSFQLGQQIESAQAVGDGKKTDRTVGLAVFDTQRGIAFLGAARGSKLTPVLSPQQGGNMVEMTFENVQVPAHQKVAIIHIIAVRGTRNEAEAFLQHADERKFLQGVPADLARRVANFPPRGTSIADREVLRGDLLDIVELRGGDQYKGTLKETKYGLQTPFGPVELPADRVIAMLSIGDYRPYQLVITSDGEAFGGAIQSPVIRLELSSGQTTLIPLASIARLGYRKREGESEEWKTEGPAVMLRTGDHLRVRPPTQPIVVSTRYGRLELKPQTIASLGFQSEDQPVHEISLVDGSRFAGLIEGDPLTFTRQGSSSAGPLVLPAASISRLQLGPAREPDEQTPMVVLSTRDRLVGTLSGTLTLDTAFDALKLTGNEIRGVVHSDNSPAEVQVTMWDGATFSGRLRGDELDIALQCGAAVKAPAVLVERYTQPYPMPSPAMMQKVAALAADLSAADEGRAARASEQLSSMGALVAGGLRAIRDKQPPAARDRIDKMLADVEAAARPKPVPPQPAPSGMPVNINPGVQELQVDQ